jgi:hypothetical protein
MNTLGSGTAAASWLTGEVLAGTAVCQPDPGQVLRPDNPIGG